MNDMKLLQRAEISEEKWDECVRASPFFRHYALTSFLDAACDNWMGLTDDDYSFVWPVPFKKFPVPRVYQPLLMQQLGPFGKEVIAEQIKDGMNLLRGRFTHIRIKFNDQVSRHQLDGDIAEHQNFELDLSPAYSMKRYNRTVQSNLKKSEKANLIIESSNEFDPWGIGTFKVSKGKEVKVLTERFYLQVQAVFQSFAAKDSALCYTAFKDDNKVAQVYLLNTNHRLLFLFSASNDLGKQFGAMHAIVDEIIKAYSGRKFILDFEGSNAEGLAYFYAGFGAERKVYLQLTESSLKWPLNKLLK